MPFRLFTEETPWEQARKETRHTAACLAADEEHAALAKPLRENLAQWNVVDQERRDADDAMVDANAVVKRFDSKLDRAVERLASRVLFEVDQNRAHAMYKAFFPEPPAEIVRLGLESEITRTKSFDRVAEEVGASKQVRAILGAIAALRQQGAEALKQREDVAGRQGRASLRAAWKESANKARRAVENALDAYAIAKGLPREYSDEFFPPAKVSKKRKKAASAPQGATPA